MNRYKPVGWRKESYRHSLAARGYASKKISDLISSNMYRRGPIAETKTHGEIRTHGDINPQGKNFKEILPDGPPTVHVYEKKTHLAGKFRDLFANYEGNAHNHLVIRNRGGEIIRELWLEGDTLNNKDTVRIDPKGGAEIITVDATDDLLYEPWMDDYGSVLFTPKNPPVGVPKGRPLKLATENDDVEYLAKKMRVVFLPPEQYDEVKKVDPEFAGFIEKGIEIRRADSAEMARRGGLDAEDLEYIKNFGKVDVAVYNTYHELQRERENKRRRELVAEAKYMAWKKYPGRPWKKDKIKLVKVADIEPGEPDQDRTKVETIKASGDIREPVHVFNKYVGVDEPLKKGVDSKSFGMERLVVENDKLVFGKSDMRKYQLYDGHHRWKAAKERGDVLIPAKVAENPFQRQEWRKRKGMKA